VQPDESTGGVFGTWQTESVGGEPTPEGVVSTITFTVENRVEGDGGVNTFGGPFTLLDGEVEFGPFFSTQKAGPEPANRHETRLFAALIGRRPFSVEGDTLVIGSGADEVRFRPITDRQSESEGETAAGETFELSGSVLYRQRVALPPDAVVTVRLRDVSLADAPSTTIAEQVIEPEHQVPIPFSLTVERSALEENHRYSLSAQITVGGHLKWTTDAHIPVSTSEPTTGIDILVVPAS
jgi:uncharacterized lipoprotein YbaY